MARDPGRVLIFGDTCAGEQSPAPASTLEEKRWRCGGGPPGVDIIRLAFLLLAVTLTPCSASRR